MRSVKLTIRIPPDLATKLYRYCRRNKRGLSNAADVLLSAGLRRPPRRPSLRPDYPADLDGRYRRLVATLDTVHKMRKPPPIALRTSPNLRHPLAPPPPAAPGHQPRR